MTELDVSWLRDIVIAVFFAIGLVCTMERGFRALGQFHKRGMERVRRGSR